VPETGPSELHTIIGGKRTNAVHFSGEDHFERRCSEQFQALIECAAVVNLRRIELGGRPVLALLLAGRFSIAAHD